MYEHLMAQRKLNPRGGLYCWWCSKISGNPFASTFDTPKITKNKASMKKLWPPNVGGVKGRNGKFQKHGNW
jgi:hypothetical protein